jgi:hypothetical protein
VRELTVGRLTAERKRSGLSQIELDANLGSMSGLFSNGKAGLSHPCATSDPSLCNRSTTAYLPDMQDLRENHPEETTPPASDEAFRAGMQQAYLNVGKLCESCDSVEQVKMALAMLWKELNC